MKNLVVAILVILVIALGMYIGYIEFFSKDITDQVATNAETSNNNEEKTAYDTFKENSLKNRTLDKVLDISWISDGRGEYFTDLTVAKNGEVTVTFTEETEKGKALIAKYGESYKVTTNVIESYIVEWGNGGYGTVVFLKEDGTLEAIDIEAVGYGNTIELIKNVGDVKNIVSVSSHSNIYDDGSVGYSAIATDIDGNTYDISEKLIEYER